jgi:uncharacterized protein (TIGR03118 family)
MQFNEVSIGARAKGAVRILLPVVTALLVGYSPFLRAQSYVQTYMQTNLVSDLPGMALVTDTNLVGAWGITRSATSPWWVNTTDSGLSLVFNAAGQPLPIIVAVPPTNPPATATGIAFNSGTGFEVASNTPARFIFATLNGTISAWSSSQSNTQLAMLMVDNSGKAGYTGITLAQNNGTDYLYAANFLQDRIDVFDSTFSPVSMPAGAFTDWKVPSSLSVFNVQLVGGSLYVTYAPTNVFGGGTGPSQGFVETFDVNGKLLQRLQNGYWMNAPWGVTLTPANFGLLGNRLLVGMFGSGAIAAFDPRCGAFQDFLRDTDALPLVIEKGLWGLGFGNGATAGPTNTLYFASDFMFDGQFHGLFGTLTPGPTVPVSTGDHDTDREEGGKHPGHDGHGDSGHGDGHRH